MQSKLHFTRDQSNWDKAEDSLLKAQAERGIDIDELAKRHLRSPHQIRLRLVQIAGASEFYNVKAKKFFLLDPVGKNKFYKDVEFCWYAKRTKPIIPYQLLFYDDPDTINRYILSSNYLAENIHTELIFEKYMDRFIEALKDYVNQLFIYTEAIKLKSYLEKNGYHCIRIEKIINAPINRQQTLYRCLNGQFSDGPRIQCCDVEDEYEGQNELYDDHDYDCYDDDRSPVSYNSLIRIFDGFDITGIADFAGATISDFLEGYTEDCADQINWWLVSKRQKLPESFIRKYAGRIDWKAVSTCQPLSEKIIREFADKVDWKIVSTYQSLSENFIREFADRIDWYSLRSPVNSVEEFIETLDTEGLKRVDWPAINKLNLSYGFRLKFKNWLAIGTVPPRLPFRSYESYEDWQEPDYEYEALKEELMDDIEADREDHARSDEEGWYYDG